jgi:diguanylate cyclase (GGDEF)-like protein
VFFLVKFSRFSYIFTILCIIFNTKILTGHPLETLDFEETIDDYKRRIFDLTTMLELGKTLNASLSLKDVLDIVVLTCNGHFHASDAVILLETEKKETPFFESHSSAEKILIKTSDPFVKYISENPHAILVDEMKDKKQLKKSYSLFSDHEIHLIVPLRFKTRINGILCLKKKEEEFGRVYSEDEKRYMDIIAGFASVAIENARLYEIATIDLKTRLYNHGFFQNRLIEEIKRAERYKTDLSLMILDLDHFKNINDTYGHMLGDDVLIAVAETLRNKVRECDIPARFGGEEFTVILPETDRDSSAIVAERLRTSIEKLTFKASASNPSPAGSFGVTTSIGISCFEHESSMTEDILIERADQSLYFAKQNGRNRVILYDEIQESMES